MWTLHFQVNRQLSFATAGIPLDISLSQILWARNWSAGRRQNMNALPRPELSNSQVGTHRDGRCCRRRTRLIIGWETHGPNRLAATTTPGDTWRRKRRSPPLQGVWAADALCPGGQIVFVLVVLLWWRIVFYIAVPNHDAIVRGHIQNDWQVFAILSTGGFGFAIQANDQDRSTVLPRRHSVGIEPHRKLVR